MPAAGSSGPPHPHHCPRLFGRARHVRHRALAQGALSGRTRGVRRRRHWAGRRAGRGAGQGTRLGRRRVLRRRPEAGVRRASTFGRRCAPARFMVGSTCWERRWRDHSSRAGRSRSHARIGADALAHGCTGKGNDQVRFELTYAAFAPDLAVIAPWREWDIRSREDALAYAAAHRVPVTATVEKIYSRDRNLWHLSHEGGGLEDPNWAPTEDVFQLTTDPTARSRSTGVGHHWLRQGHAGLGERHGARPSRTSSSRSIASAGDTGSDGSIWSRTGWSA